MLLTAAMIVATALTSGTDAAPGALAYVIAIFGDLFFMVLRATVHSTAIEASKAKNLRKTEELVRTLNRIMPNGAPIPGSGSGSGKAPDVAVWSTPKAAPPSK